MARSHGGGSRSSGGRSSFGGGSRSHGSSLGSSRRSSMRSSHYHMGLGPRPPHHHRGGIHIYHGGPVNPFAVLISFAFFFIFLFGVLFFVNMSSRSVYEDNLNIIEQDYNYYQEMISYAEDHPEYQVVGVIDAIKYDSEFGSYYIDYSYHYGHNDFFKNTQSTFATYSFDDIKSLNLEKGAPILLAIEDTDIDMFTDSIDMAYKNVSLEEDPEYKLALKKIAHKKNMTKIFGAILAGIVVITIVISFLIIKKNKNKKVEETGSSTTNNNNSTTTDTSTEKYCNYCGAKLPEGKTKCPLCGASNNNK